MGNGTQTASGKTGDISGLIFTDNGKKGVSATLKNVAYAKDAEYNLFSLTYMMMKGWTMLGDKEKIILKKGDTELKFTHKVKTNKGFLFVINCAYHTNGTSLQWCCK